MVEDHGSPGDGRLLRGQRTRAAVLDAAVALASVEGLDGLSLGRLAQQLGVSKSGLFAHWRTKEELQLDAVERARQSFIDQVVRPALGRPRGVRRLWAVHECQMAYYSAGVLPGGCFFAAVQPEFDDRPGAVRTRVLEAKEEFALLLSSLAAEAIELGELAADADAEQLAFEIESLGGTAVLNFRLTGRDDAFRRARRAVLHRLRALCPDPSILPEE